MNQGGLADRGRAVEEAFFARQNEQLRQQLRQAGAIGDDKAGLAAASGIKDEALLDCLVGLDVGQAGGAALSLIPLVAVAWADGELDPRERAALLAAATHAGLRKSDPAYPVFEGWLSEPPGPDLLARWHDYVGALAREMTPEARLDLQREILGRARAVAEAAGGFLGLGGISAAEKKLLATLEAAFAE